MGTERVIAATYDFGGSEADNPLMNIDKVYLVMPKENAVIPFNTYQKLRYSPKTVNHLVAVLPGNRLGIFSQEDFTTNEITDTFKFRFKTTGEPVNSAAAIRELLGV